MARSTTSMHGAFPAGSRLLAQIHPIEIERGIFIVGHRLEPLRDEGTVPWEATLLDEKGGPFTTRNVALSVKDAYLFFSLLGMNTFQEFLLEQDHKNGEPLLLDQPSGIVRLAAFDFKDYFSSHGLAAVDYLEFELLDTSGRSFSVRPRRAADIESGSHDSWLANMGAAVRKALAALDGPVAPHTFIREAFRRAPRGLLRKPAAAFSEYYNESQALEIRDFGGASFMWSRDADFAALLVGKPSRPPEGADELETAIAKCGLGLSKAEISCFVKDALHEGRSIGDALERCFVGVRELGFPKAAVDRLFALATKHGEEIRRSYNKAKESSVVVKLRRQILELYTDFLSWMRRIGSLLSDPKELDTEEFSDLSRTMSYLCEFLEILEIAPPQKNADLRDFQAAMPSMREITHSLMDGIEKNLGRGRVTSKAAGHRAVQSAHPRSGTKSSGTGGKPSRRHPSRRVYFIVARLADIEPPIHRFIMVPGNRSLHELHLILQHAFGWTDSHLHLFRVKGVVFGEPSPDDYEPVKDERETSLDDLGLRGRSTLEYVYDFGDNWLHELVVRSSRASVPDDPDRPVCISASRAAPPEDCGGSPGYEAILEARAKPPRKRDEDDANLVTWAKGWDPEECDQDLINSELDDD